MDAVYRIANILLGRHNQWEGKHAGGGHAVVEPEHPGVNVHMRHVQEPPQLPEYFQHCQALYNSKRFYLKNNLFKYLCYKHNLMLALNIPKIFVQWAPLLLWFDL